MKTPINLAAAGLLVASTASILAAVRYVDVNSANSTPPYTNWTTAATNIQDAVDASVACDEIVVTDGIYASGGRAVDGTMTNRVVVDKPLILRSVNGPQFTIIQGHQVPDFINGDGAVRCVYLVNGASLSGFTLTNGGTHVVGDGPTFRQSGGGAMWCESTNSVVVSNCVVAGNSAYLGGGAYGGTLNNCTITGNSARRGGGVYGCMLKNCTLIENYADHGGGAYGGTLNNCIVTHNLATFYWIRANNSLYPSSGGYGGGTSECILNNCALNDNSAVFGGGASGGSLNNCTLTGNSGSVQHGSYYDRECGCMIDVYYGGRGGGAWSSALNNCIAYFNDGGNHDSSSLNYSCTTPLPTKGIGNITNAPLFVNSAAGNHRLRPDSPCIDAGTNLNASITNDLDGRPRPLDGNGDGLAAFDIGAYEYRTPLLVWQNSPNPTPPHADWATAAHTIQDAVDAGVAGDEIVVTNGIYASVVVDKPLSLLSINGPQFTTINGHNSVRCVSLTSNASLSGFALIYGLGSNRGGGVYGGTLYNCWLSGNSCYRGTAQYPAPQSYGGGAYGSTLNNCTLSGNSASHGGGAAGCTLNNCTLTGNRAFGAFDLSNGPGRGGGADYSTLNNCTIVGNGGSANNYGGGVSGSTLYNCIIYSNNAAFGENHYSSTLHYSCTTPQPTNGIGNITNPPLFMDQASGNLRLQSNSPCINAGRNAFAPAGPDLDGNPRIAGVTVDIGAYEFQLPTSIISYAWLQQYGLPSDGSADITDPDGDRMNNWQEWRCATDPTNALSSLRLLAPTVLGSNLLVRWESVADRTYFLDRSTAASSAFTPLATGISGQPGTTSFTDTNAIGAGPSFYRVGVEE